MQLMWISSPLGKMHAFSITKRGVLMVLLAGATVFVFLGAALHFFGLRMAIQLRPDLVRAIGGVITAVDLQRRDANYRVKLVQLQDQLNSAEQQVRQLQALKDSFMQLALPKGRNTPVPPLPHVGKMGMGGPDHRVTFDTPRSASSVPLSALTVADDMDVAKAQFEALNQSLERLQSEWKQQLVWLAYLPTGVPIAGTPDISSGFGVRIDPFTGLPARHEGLDFAAPPGTPILAAASGVVTRVAKDPDYGNMVDIDHGNGFMTRYGHAKAIYVKVGQHVTRGMKIGAVGSTGRSTGPHLHFEVHHGDKVLDPKYYLAHLN